jgi:hypothetical protein
MVLFPAIGTAIPLCMHRDLWVSVAMNLDGDAYEPGREVRAVVSVQPIPVKRGPIVHPRRPEK